MQYEVAGNELKRVAVGGGAAITVTEATNSAGGTWLGNDRILAFTDEGGDLLQVSFGGEREEWDLQQGGAAPHALPDGSHVLWSSDQIAVFDTRSRELHELPIRGNDPRYLGGFLFYTQGNTLYAVRFDPGSLSLQGTPVPVQTGLRVEIYGFSQWALSQNGTFLYAPGIAAAENPLVWVGGEQEEDLRLPLRQKGTPKISPNDKHLAVLERQSGSG